MLVHNTGISYCIHDGNKNVSEVIFSNGEVGSHYEYGPFGAENANRSYNIRGVVNFLRFSSEYYDDETATIYYNFRFLNPFDGRYVPEKIFRLYLDPGLADRKLILAWDDKNYFERHQPSLPFPLLFVGNPRRQKQETQG